MARNAAKFLLQQRLNAMGAADREAGNILQGMLEELDVMQAAIDAGGGGGSSLQERLVTGTSRFLHDGAGNHMMNMWTDVTPPEVDFDFDKDTIDIALHFGFSPSQQIGKTPHTHFQLVEFDQYTGGSFEIPEDDYWNQGSWASSYFGLKKYYLNAQAEVNGRNWQVNQIAEVDLTNFAGRSETQIFIQNLQVAEGSGGGFWIGDCQIVSSNNYASGTTHNNTVTYIGKMVIGRANAAPTDMYWPAKIGCIIYDPNEPATSAVLTGLCDGGCVVTINRGARKP